MRTRTLFLKNLLTRTVMRDIICAVMRSKVRDCIIHREAVFVKRIFENYQNYYLGWEKEGRNMKKMITCPICGAKYGKADELKDLELVCFRCKSELVANVTSKGVTVEVLREADEYGGERKCRHTAARA